ncbi:AAA family ATPase [Streptomyces sp. H39-C1]|uniref:AAA family ATPase n=1 Tax=Streptomyces sp. H39-C1 TaxID=3004355 RepID=UPI0022AFAE58|nr:AAA family ATPase [Streptomyces sp. H39-C1]MCZ4100808.1 AAA family ATPase [Streptomyces sp. H39-C1]
MPTFRQGVPPRLRRALEILAESPDGMHVQDLWARIVADFPVEEYEAVSTKTGRQTKGENNWRWYTSDAVLAGLVWKQKGVWCVTSLSLYVLAQSDNPEDLLEITRSALNYAEKHRAGYQYATKILETAVQAGQWVVLDDVAEMADLEPDRLAAWLCGIRPPGGQRVLGADGRPPSQIHPEPNQIARWQQLLAGEGLPLDATGAALPAHRVSTAELGAALSQAEATNVEGLSVRRGWLIRGAAVQGVNMVPKWRAEAFCSLSASRLQDLPEGLSQDQLKLLVDDRYSHLSYNQRTELAEQLFTFLDRVHPNDLVVTVSGGRLHFGTVSGPAQFTASSDGRSNLRRAVKWVELDIDQTDLPEELQAKLTSQHDVVDLTQLLDVLEEFFDLSPDEGPEASVIRRVLRLPDPIAELADELLVDLPWLKDVRDLLDERRQVIFYGPPGTGKTYLAQAIAEHLAGDPQAVKLIQFHPSYSYEDFFEGFRPVQQPGGGGGVSFELRPGPLRKLVALAESNPDTPHFLIIDEINRANLAKVFGELYFVLEYRNRTVDLQYSGEFTLPSNIYFIGTMNTADRSIALVDAAMRRRFAFVELHPDESPTRDLLARWLAREGLAHETEDVPELLRTLNSRIEDKDLRIGPSYLMRESIYVEGGLARTWRSAILPLLEEHHYGEGVNVESRYGLDALRRSLARATAPDAGPETLDSSPGGDGAQ